jgi:hypothetical protein
MITKGLVLCLCLLLVRSGDASVLDWFWGGARENADPRLKTGDVPIVKVPFEISIEDEKFLQEARKYTSLKLSDLDDCQHRVSKKNSLLRFVKVVTDIMAISIRLKQYEFFAGCNEYP